MAYARLLALGFLAWGVAQGMAGRPAAAAEGARPVRMLWLGSSSLYYHDMPKVCAGWLAEFGQIPAESHLGGRSGTGIHAYLRPGFKAEYGLNADQTVLDKIAADKYDLVVLQVAAEFITGPEGDEHDRSLDVYCRAIRGAGGEPVIYEMGWQRNESAEVGRGEIFAAAVRNQVRRFVPCSTAWQRVRQERPDLDLHNPPDTVHPGTLGAYLNLSCFYAALSGRHPDELPRELLIWRRLTDEEKRQTEEVSQRADLDEYDSALPGWMKRLVLAAKSERIDEQTAAYLKQVAWEEVRAARNRLAAAIAGRRE